MNRRELFKRIARGETENVRFGDFQRLIEGFGFQLRRINGSHHIYSHPEVRGNLNLQPQGGDAINYQVKQFLKLVEKYELHLGE